MARKILTIGITINLENYENLRLEVQGEVGPEGSTEDLIQFLDGMLARLGHGDEATAELVENYRRRVLAMPGTVAAGEAAGRREVRPPLAAARPAPAAAAPMAPVPGPGEPAPAPEAGHEPPPLGDETPVTVRVSPEGKAVKAAAKAPARSEGQAAPVPARAPEPRKVPAPHAMAESAKPAAKAPAQPEKPAIAEGEVACEACGASITRNQEKLSKLLTGKSLCKRCMNP